MAPPQRDDEVKIERYNARLEWGLGVTWGRRLLRIGFGPWLWRIEWGGIMMPAFQRGDDQQPAQWLIPFPFASSKPWLLITWTWPPSMVRL